ncbi:MAG: hypothetical protein K8R87_01075 [Verrucomicrobia bacterium]|nr:hypothetical protein [Verrucomicrobiota bacterium]
MSDNYFQFPISALSYGMHLGRWNDVLYLACLHYGRSVCENDPDDLVTETIIEDYLSEPSRPTCDDTDQDERALVVGFARLNINATSGTIKCRLEEARNVQTYCDSAPYPTVRIRTDLWWKTFTPQNKENPLSFREFAVLCAVYAAIGAKPFVKATHLMLRRYAAGYPSEEAFQKAPKPMRQNSLWLTPKMLRRTLDALETNQFFAKFTFNRGECFYTNKMDKGKLIAAVTGRKLRKLETLSQSRVKDAAGSAEILRRRAVALSASKIVPAK